MEGKRGLRNSHSIIIAGFIIGLFLFLGLYFSGASIDSMSIYDRKEEGLVTSVIDGDTVRVEGEDVRLLGIDTSEKGEDCYFEAKSRLEELILHEEVEMEREGRNEDDYGRELRYLFLDNENINLKLVEEGLARIMIYEDNVKYREELIEAEEKAREEEIGCLWNEDFDSKNISDRGRKEWSRLEEGIDACNASNYIGKEVIVEGEVEDSFKKDMTAIFLNLDGVYPDHCFTIVIWQDYWHKFPDSPQNYYYGEDVRVRGEIEEYNGKPQIVLEEPENIEIGE